MKKDPIALQTLPVAETPGQHEPTDPFDTAAPPQRITPALLWSFRRVILKCLTISFAGFLFGWDTGVISGILSLKTLLETIGHWTEDGYALDTVVHGLLVGCYHIGCILGGFTLVRLADFKGRRIPIILAMCVYILGNLIQMLTSQSRSWVQFMVGRFVSGLCIGSIGVLVPMFISETSPTVIRGSLTTLYLLMITTGIMMGSIFIYAMKCALPASNAAWMISLGVPMCVAMLVVGGIVHAPESARYLVSIGDIQGAETTLKRIGELDVPGTLRLLESKLQMEHKADEVGYIDMLRNKRHRKRLFTGVMVMFLQQMSGIDYFFYFGTQLFYSVGINDSYVTMIILAVVNYFTSWAVMFVVEKFGRKKTLLVGSAACFTTLMVYALVGVTMVKLDASDASENRLPGVVMIVFTCIYIIAFGSTWAGCGNVVVVEMFPLHIRSKAMGVSIAFNWGANFFIAFCTPIVTAEIHYYFGLVFAGCMFVSFWFVLFFVPETKGILLEEIDGVYETRELKAGL